jgi:FkbM family methyltransferase
MHAMNIMEAEERIRTLSHRQRHFLCEKLTEISYSRYLREGDSAIDCGANIGHHTRLLSKVVGPGGRVHAFEPNPALFKGLLALGTNIRLWPFAAGDELQICRLHIPEGLIGWASLEDIRGLLPDRSFRLVTTAQVRIDDLVELRDEMIRFVKIDVERSELRALRGMQALLQKDRPVVVFEGLNPGIRDFLAGIGFEIRDLLGRPVEGGRPIMANVVAVPAQDADGVLNLALPQARDLAEAFDTTMATVKE